jgi:endoglucanase
MGMTVYWRGDLVWGEEPAFPYCSGGAPTLGTALSVRYEPRDPGAPTDVSVMPRLFVDNDGVADVALNDLELRYWFTAGTSASLQGWVDFAAIGAQHVQTSFLAVAPTAPLADHYLTITFQPEAGDLVAGATTGPIELRFNRSTWQPLDETDDYSYSAAADGDPWPYVTLYYQEELVWGAEP